MSLSRYAAMTALLFASTTVARADDNAARGDKDKPAADATLERTDKTTTTTTTRTDAKANAQVIAKLSRYIGADVRNKQDADLGEVEDIMLSHNGKVQYLIVGHGGVLGIGENLVAVPWKIVGYKGDTVLLDMTKEKLEQAPNFKKDAFASLSDSMWSDKTYAYFNVTHEKDADHHKADRAAQPQADADKPQTTTTTTTVKVETKSALFRASQLIGLNVRGQQDDTIAEIKDLVLNHKQNKVDYAILGHGGVLTIGESYLAVPWQALAIRHGEDQLMASLPMTKERLNQAPQMKEDYSGLMQRDFVDNTNRFFGVEGRTEIETETPAQREKDLKRDQNPNQNRDENRENK